jgi:hypothetical protein
MFDAGQEVAFLRSLAENLTNNSCCHFKHNQEFCGVQPMIQHAGNAIIQKTDLMQSGWK